MGHRWAMRIAAFSIFLLSMAVASASASEKTGSVASGLWQVVDSAWPKTVQIYFTDHEFSVRACAIVIGGKYRINHRAIYLNPETSIEGWTCSPVEQDAASLQAIQSMINAGLKSVAVSLKDDRLIVTDGSGASLTFRRAPTNSPRP